jgi:YHS domain-containing protein
MRLSLIALLIIGSHLMAADQATQNAPTPYPFDTCLIAGSALDSMGGPYVHVHEGQELKFCCRGCLPAFQDNVAQHMARVRAAFAEDKAEEKAKAGTASDQTATNQQADTASAVAPYPLTTCAVTGAALGSMGGPYVFVHQGQEIKLCCKGCKAGFLENAEELMKPIRAAGAQASAGAQDPAAQAQTADADDVAGQSGNAPTAAAQTAEAQTTEAQPTTCLVSGEPLEPDMMVAHEHHGQTLHFCCKGCARKFQRDPARYLGTTQD